MKDQLTSLFEYGEWVTQRLLETAAGLTDEEFSRRVIAGFGSTHLTFVHILGGEVLWSARWQGESPKTILAPDDLPTVAAIRERWEPLIRERSAYLVGLQEADLYATVRWTNMRGQPFALPRGASDAALGQSLDTSLQ